MEMGTDGRAAGGEAMPGEAEDDLTRIGDMAKTFGVTLRALRFYEDKGLLQPRREGATRLYTRRDKARLKLILLGRRVGFSLRDVKQMIDLYDPTGSNTRQLRLTLDKSEKQLARTEGILNSMTPLERAKPELIKASRKRRIATGSGVPVQEVNRLLKQFEQMQGMMKQMKKGGMAKMMRAMGGMKGLGGFGRGGFR